MVGYPGMSQMNVSNENHHLFTVLLATYEKGRRELGNMLSAQTTMSPTPTRDNGVLFDHVIF